LIEKIKKYRQLRNLSRKLIDLLQKRNPTENEIAKIKNLMKMIKNLNPLREEIFDNLRAFKNFYNKNIKWFESRINAEREDFTKHLGKKLQQIKNQSNNNKSIIDLDNNWKKALKKAVGSIKQIDHSEKHIIIQILNKSELTESEIKNLALILSKLETDPLIGIFGETFRLHTQNYVKWGFDFYRNIKIDILKQYFIRKNDIIHDAGDLFRAIRKQLSLYPNPCYCIQKTIENIEFFSLFLGLKSYYVKYKSQRSQKSKQLGLDLLKIISSNLSKSFEYWILRESDPKIINKVKNIENNIRKIIENYKNAHKLKLYALGGNGILEQHPYLKLDYFKEIDTLEKAYWLGWLFAEGYITIKKIKSGKEYYRFGVGCLQDDFILLERFADALGLDIINNQPSKEEYTTSKGETHVLRRIRIINNKFCKNLISHGFIVGKRKSKNIRLPQFKRRELLLAFLLGYYDGDGTMGRSRITSSSKKLLADILNSPFLNIPVSISNSIQFDPVNKKYIIKGDKISLGADLMREMVKNYDKSLPRKRQFWENWVDKRTLGLNRPTPKIDLLYKNLPKKKLLDLYLVKNFTLKKIAKMHEVSYDTLKRYMIKIGLKGSKLKFD